MAQPALQVFGGWFEGIQLLGGAQAISVLTIFTSWIFTRPSHFRIETYEVRPE